MGSDDTSNLPGLALGVGFSLHQNPPTNKEKEKLNKDQKTNSLSLKFDHVFPSLSLGSLQTQTVQGDRKPGTRDEMNCLQTSSISPGSSYSDSSTVKKEKSGSGGRDDFEVDKVTSSRASDEDEEASPRKKLRLTKEQSAVLEDSFKDHSTLNPNQKQALAMQLNLQPRQVEVWFQNRRARTKLKQTEMDCELLKKCCDNLTEENKRLHRELQELRALKLASAATAPAAAVFMQLPATTLTMCPSCERLSTGGSSSSGAGVDGGGDGGRQKGAFYNPFARSTAC